MKRIVGPKPSEQVLPPRRAGVERLRVDDDLLAAAAAPRARPCSRRPGSRSGRASSSSSPRSSRRTVNVPWIAVPFDVIEATWPALHLLEEERAVRDADARLRLRRARRDPVVDDEQADDPGDPPRPKRMRGFAAGRLRAGAGPRARSRRSRREWMPVLSAPRPRPSRARRSSPRRGPCPRRRSTRARCARRGRR